MKGLFIVVLVALVAKDAFAYTPSKHTRAILQVRNNSTAGNTTLAGNITVPINVTISNVSQSNNTSQSSSNSSNLMPAAQANSITYNQTNTSVPRSFGLLDPNDCVILLLDHQTGLLQTVQDVSVRDLRINLAILTKLVSLRGIPLITTASEPQGSNGPLISEVQNAQNAIFVRRHGEISAWENPDFVHAVQATGKKTLIMAGIWTSVCVAFPAIQAIGDGYKVWAVLDASGDISHMSSLASQLRMQQAGVVLATTNVIIGELQRTWNRTDAASYGALYDQLSPNYGIGAQQ